MLSPDGTQIVFVGGNGDTLYQKATSGVATEVVLDKRRTFARSSDWSKDGRYILEEHGEPTTRLDVWVHPLFGDKKPFPYLHSEFTERYAKLSPNGKWLAYVSDETRRNEVYVQTFPNPGGKWQVSNNGGSMPIWSRDGKELFFISVDSKMMAVEVKPSDKFEAGVPQPLFDTRLQESNNTWYDVSKDGRFLIPVTVDETGAGPVTVVLNWAAGVKK